MKTHVDKPTNTHEIEQGDAAIAKPQAGRGENQPNAIHARSHAAHLGTGNDDPKTRPAVRPGLYPGARKQPNGSRGNRNRTTGA